MEQRMEYRRTDTRGKAERIAILDCGGQYTKVIDRRVRDLSVRSEIFPIGVRAKSIRDYSGIILSGGPSSVWSRKRLRYDRQLFELGLPVLGICYGMHLVNRHYGGTVRPGLKQEYGVTEIEIDPKCPLFDGLNPKQRVLMSHGDSIESLAPSFRRGAVSEDTLAAIYDAGRNMYGVQFHPEVDLTANGSLMLESFLKRICGLKGSYRLDDRIESAMRSIKKQVGESPVIVLVSGGVDSAVSASLLLKALKPGQITAIHVDHGLMRKGESDRICGGLRNLGLSVNRIDAEDIFLDSEARERGRTLGPLTQTIHPEEKRRIIGNLFVRVVAETAKGLDLNFRRAFLAQGTLRPDLIESGNPDVSSHARRIKTHHNDVDLIRRARAKGRVVETNWDWHKDEVRAVARKLGLDEAIASRQPFPGPGLAIRMICHDGMDRVSEAQRRGFETALADTPFDGTVLPIKTVGVQGDNRSYRFLALLHRDRLAANWEGVEEWGKALPDRLEYVNRVAYLLNRSRPPDRLVAYKRLIDRNGLSLLRELDAVVREALERPAISQAFAVLLPLASSSGMCSVAIRCVVTNDYMTARPAHIGGEIPVALFEELIERIETRFHEVELILYDVTSKPPATVEWE
jgi:GMP synthase (glutamine-hydrolysing)